MISASNVYLVGPMGVGKTTVGRALAKSLGMDFIDSDARIEERTGVSISTIFDIEGEGGFREREAQMIFELVQQKNIVLATGGGAVTREDVRKAMRHNGLVIYLHATVDMLVERTRSSKNRPLLNTSKEPREVLETLMQEREPLYRAEADIVFETDARSPHAVARDICSEIRQRWQR
ncbi:MAG: shikimate kinase AroK [Acidiferrobacteraceae bacterium]|jgi:shikimate kinase|nr:shikimate kinase AroK [Acidiferrobacteraceae bacterium]MCP4829260.1 shikimate kinase AroK [Pseudomonadota bacterium]HJP06350.1 shikimate kinase AroK [Arenicellales bacterium]|tara:strand:- start:4993 stop:5523 length:531 start_codon:yes stop_codon:yes gene_type:complete